MPDDAVVQVISRLGVDYSQAISSTKLFKAEAARLNAQLKALKMTAADLGRVSGVGMTQQAKDSKVILDRHGNVLSTITTQNKELQKQATIMQGNVKKAASIDSAARKHKRTVKDLNAQYSVLGSQFERRAGWFFAGTAFFGGLAAGGAAVRTISEVEAGMTQIARITEDVTFNFAEMRDELMDLGVEYGMLWENVSDISTRWAQAGYNVKDVLELTRASLLALNTAELDAQYATQGLIAIMSQWNLTSQELLPTIDKINKTADNFAITSQDIVDGLNRTGATAKNAGLSIEETIGMITALREASGRTGKEVGTALRTILSYMTRQKTVNLMESLGIRVFEDEAKTTFRSVIELMDELQSRWQDTSTSSKFITDIETQLLDEFNEDMATAVGLQEEWNDLQQRDIGQAAAGVRRRNFFISLMERFSKVQEVVNGQLDAEGYSMRENERTMATLAKQYGQLKAAAEKLAVAIGDAGLTYQLKELTTGLRDITTWFNELDPTLRSLIINFAEITIAVKVFGAVLKMAGIGQATNLLSGWAVSATAATAATRTLTGATTGLMTVLLNTGRGLVAFFGGPLGLAITAATAAFMAFRSTADASAAAMEDNAKKARETANEIQRLRDRYIELAGKTELTNAEQGEFESVTSRLLDLVPSAITGFDEMGNAITNMGAAAEASAGKIALLREEQERLVRAKASVAQTVLPGLREGLVQQQRDFEALAEATRLGPEMARGNLLSMTDGIIAQGKVFFAESEEVVKMAEDKLNAIAGSMAELRKEIAGYESALKIVSGTPDEKTGGGGGEDRVIPGRIAPVSRKEATSAIRSQADALVDAISQLERANRKYEYALARTGDLLNFNASEYSLLTQKITDGTATSEDYARAQELVAVKVALLEQEQAQLHSTNESYRRNINSLTPVLQEATRQYEAFRNAGDAEHMEEAAQAVTKLQDKIQELSSALSQNSAQWWENQRAVMETKRALSEDYFSRLTSWIQHMASVGRLTTEQQAEYYRAIDRTNLSLRSQRQIEEELYNLRRGALQDQMSEIKDAYDERMSQIEDEIEAEEEATQAKIDQKDARIKAIDDETSAQIEALEALIDALGEEGEQTDRTEAERKHNQKMVDLKKDLQYHELRTGLEHQKAIDDINRQIAEEEHEWELQKQEWARQDQKDAYRDQIASLKERAEARKDAIREEINDIQEASDDKKKELRDYYDDVQSLINDRTLDMLAALSATDDQWYERGLGWMRKLADGIRDGQTELPGGIEEFVGDVEEAEGELPPAGKGEHETEPPPEPKIAKAAFPSSSYINKDGTTYAWSRLIADKLGMPVTWDEKNWMVKIGGKGFTPDFIKNDLAYLGLRRVGESFGYDVRYDDASKVVSYFPQAHTGAYVAGGGIAELLKDERVLSPQLTVSFDRLAGVLTNFPSIPDKISLMQQYGYGGINRAADRIIAAIERRKGIQIGNLLNAENVELADGTDMDILSRELARAVGALQAARG